MKRITTTIISIFILFVATTAYSEPLQLTLRASSLRAATAPEQLGGSILFSYEFPGSSRSGQMHTVLAAFEHEGYNVLHSYRRNQHGIYVLIVDGDPATQVIRYRLVVDGLWTTDPAAPGLSTDRWGVRISELQARSTDGARMTFPAVDAAGTVEFRVSSQTGGSVALVGTFNGWDPYMTPMTEIEPGVYARTVRLTPGEHLYAFVADGRRFADPKNGNRRVDSNGLVVSAVSLP